MRAKVLSPTFENISFAAEALHHGEIIAVPTETVYGLAGDCHSPLALARIFDSKERPTFDPLIVHVGISGKRIEDLEHLGVIDSSHLTSSQREWIEILIGKFWPGPLTLVLPKHKYLPELVTSGLPTVAVRMPRHPVMLSLLARLGKPLAAPSANRFGHISPTSAAAVVEELGERIDFILDGGECEIGVESTILNLSKPGQIEILRYGGVPIEEISAVLPTVSLIAPPGKPSDIKQDSLKPTPTAPGMLLKHYSPDSPFYLLSKRVDENLDPITVSLPEGAPVGLIVLAGDPTPAANSLNRLLNRPIVARSLSIKGDLNEAAHSLFSTLRELDSLKLGAIFSEPCLEQKGLGYAIADRLRRAAAQSDPS